MLNEVLKIIESRRSVRTFATKGIPEFDLQKVLQAAHHAPSAHNQQSWRFVVVSGTRKQELATLVGTMAAEFARSSAALLRMAARSISSAPVVIGVVSTGELIRLGADPARTGGEKADNFYRTMEIQSSAAAVENLLLAAASLGISSVWLG